MSKRKKKYTGISNKTLDILWARKVKEIAGYKCEICGTSDMESAQLQAHHLVPRKIYSTRWYLPNGICLCKICHTNSPTSAHKNPVYFFLQILERRGRDSMEKLAFKAMEKYNKTEKHDIKKELIK